MSDPFIIAVDFDGTICKDQWVLIGDPVPGAVEALRGFQQAGCRIILWTCRCEFDCQHIESYLLKQGIILYGINRNPGQPAWSDSPKAYANVYIDDKAAGCPLVYPKGEVPYVDWAKVQVDVVQRIARHV